MKNDIVVAPIDVSGSDEARKQADLALSEARGLIIKDQEGYDKAGTLLGAIKGRIKSLDALRKSITQPLDVAKKKVMELFAGPLTSYELAEQIVKDAVYHFDNEQEKIRKEAEDKLAREAEKKRKEIEEKAAKARAEGKDDKADKLEQKAAEVIAPTIAPTVIKPSGIQYRDQWTAEVTDFTALPNEYKIANQPMLNKLAIATKGNVPIPGVRFIKSKIVASRSA